ncbi:MAG TPA: hypothetical protein VLJ86_14120 [Ramlibacter sp.]|nr:hypothetical protein [Ramlibacter sp.]
MSALSFALGDEALDAEHLRLSELIEALLVAELRSAPLSSHLSPT